MELDETKEDCSEHKDSVFCIQRIMPGKRKKGHAIVLKDKEIVLGRHPEASVVISSENVSRKHAILTRTADSYGIKDARSLNGVWVNKDQLKPLVPRSLVPGDTFSLGNPEETQHMFLFSRYSGNDADSSPSSKVPRAEDLEKERQKKEELDEQVKRLQQELDEKRDVERRLQERLEAQQKEYQENLELERERIQSERQEAEVRLRQELQEQMEAEEKALQEQRMALLTDKERVEQELRQKLTQEMQESLLQQQQRLNKDLEESAHKAQKLEEQLAQSRQLQTQSKSDMIHRFGDLLETELNCSICSELFAQAHTLGCSHTFCKHCITVWKKKKNECPICRTKIKSMVHALVVDNFIEQMVGNLSPQLKVNRIKLLKERGLPYAHLEKELLNCSGTSSSQSFVSSSASTASPAPFQISILPTTSNPTAPTAVTLRQPSILLRPVNGTSLPPGFQSLLESVPGTANTFRLLTTGGVQTLQRVSSAPARNSAQQLGARSVVTSVASSVRANTLRPSGNVRPTTAASNVRPFMFQQSTLSSFARPTTRFQTSASARSNVVVSVPLQSSTTTVGPPAQAPIRGQAPGAQRRGARTRGGHQPTQTDVAPRFVLR